MKGIKTVKRFLLAYVILAMACMGIMTNYTTAEAATTFKTWECYKANYYLECSPYNYYMSDRFSAPYRSIVKENSTSSVFNGLLTSWEVATFSLSNVTEYSQKRTGYYEAFLYDVLYEGYDQKALMGALKKGAKSTQASALKSVTKLLKKTEMTYGKTKLASMSDEELQNFAKSLQECNELSSVFDVVSSVTTVFSYATTVEEVLYKASKAATIMNTASDNADILDRIANATTDASLKKACNNLASICRKEMSEDELIQIMIKDEAIDELHNKFLGKVWSKVLEQLGTYGIAVKAGQSLGKAFAELFFSTNTQIETYYEMQCLYEFEDRLTDAVRTYASNYQSSATTENAKLFNNAFEMLMQTYELGCDIAIKYNESTYDKGALNILVSRISGDIEKFNKYKDSVNFIKNTINGVYTFATKDMYNSYLEDCCTDVADTINMDPAEAVGTKEDLDNQVVALEANVQKASNMYISSDYKLTGDVETYGSLYLSGGTLDLNGYSLTIHGDIHQTNGVLFVNSGKLTVDGDYGIYRTQKNSTTGDTEIIYTYGYLKMVKAADSITVGGNLTVCINEDTRGYLTAGTLVLKGNFRQIYDGSSYGFCATGTHTTILAGEGTQELSFDSAASGFNELKTVEGYQGKIALKNNIKFNKLGSDLAVTGENLYIGDSNLNGHRLLVTGNATMYADVDLQGGEWEVTGNLRQTNGVLYVNSGKLTVDGDYGIYQTQKNSTTGDTEITHTYGYLKMVKAADSITVGGNLTVCINEDTRGYLTAGTLVLKGNFRQIYDGSSYGFCATGTHTTILAGEGTQELSFDSAASGFNELKTVEGYQGKIALKNNIKFNKLGSDLAVTGENLYIGDSNLNGHKLSVTGNATMYADVDLQGGEWEVTGNLRQTYGILYVNGGRLTVDGDYGVYRTQKNSTTGDTEITHTYGYLKMVKAADSITVGGNLTVCINEDTRGYLTAGTLVLKGNFRQIYDGSSYGFCATGTHTTILAGEGTQELSFDSSASGFNELKTVEGYQGKIALKNNIKFNKLGSDLAVTGENLYIGDSNLNGHKLSVTGNATMYADVDLQGGEWEVTGNLRQTYGILYVNGGRLTVDGDYGVYRTQKNSTTGDTEITHTYGYLKMVKAADSITVGGNLTVCINEDTRGYLTAGTLVLKGNFRQIYDGSSYGFCATGTHTTILAGEGTQRITFDSTASQFNNLKLTGDKDTDYVFSREVCWDQIYMNTDVRAVNVYPKDKILTKGTAWKFTAAVAGINKPSQEVTWSVEGASGSRTQISEAGILTVDLHETADTLKVRAVSRQDPQYAGFVTVTLKDAVPVVEWVQITPNHVGLGLGDFKQFEAVVYGENEPEQTVIWQVTGNTSPDTMIDEDGILYIGRDELADSIVIEATSKLDETKKASETVSILRTTISENTIVEKVHVSPQKADVEVGQRRQYKAVVMGVNGPSQEVQWSVSNNSCPSTSVDASGLLTVAEEEESEELTVIATSVENEQIAGTATVSVIRLSILPVADKVIILLKPGDTIALSARVLGANAPSQAVNWRIEGNTSDKTLIDENGVLSIGKNEKTNKITVIAASAENPEIENRVQFDVQPSTCMHTNTEVRNQKESTCLEKGYTGDIFCKDCEDQVGIGNEIPAKGHAWDAGKVVKEATYEEAGTILYTCQTCGAQKQDDLDRLQRPETDEKTQENKKQQTDNGKTDGEQTGQKEKLSGGELIKQKNAEYIVKSDGTVSCGKVKNANGKLTFPDTVQDENGNTYVVSEVGKDAFKDNKSVTEVVIGNKVKTIALNAFAGCSKLKKVVLGDAVEVISDNAFANCGKLQTVTMKKKVTRIGARAFYKCKSLKKIVIPASVKKIGKQAFYQCKNLRSITIKTTKLTKKRVGSNAFKGIHAKAKIKVPKKKLALYKKVLRSRGVGKKAKIMK